MDERLPVSGIDSGAGVPAEKFSSPEEEIAFLRQQITERERALLERNREADATDFETVGKQELFEYGTFTPQQVLSSEQVMSDTEIAKAAKTSRRGGRYSSRDYNVG